MRRRRRARAAVLAAMGLLAAVACNSSMPGGEDAGTGIVIGPGCLGVPNGSCSPDPTGTVCPGPPMVCVSCGAGLYTMSQSNCTCATGAWSCEPPAIGEVQCSTMGAYVDPACTVLYPGDAGEDGGFDAGVDTGADTGVDSGLEGGVDAPSDASSEDGGG